VLSAELLGSKVNPPPLPASIRDFLMSEVNAVLLSDDLLTLWEEVGGGRSREYQVREGKK